MSEISNERCRVAGWEWGVLIFAIAVGAVLRIWMLQRVPGLWYDEAINGLDALAILRGEGGIFFSTENHMREPMYMYLEALGVLIGGQSALALRAVSTFIGILTIPIIWLLAREMKGPMVAAVAALLFALMRWHVHFSGLAFRTVLAPFFAALVVFFFCRAIRRRSVTDAILSGLALGAGAYTYLAFRLMPIIILFPMIVALVQAREAGERRLLLQLYGWIIGAAAIVFLPLGVNYVQNPEHFSGRGEEVSLLDRERPAQLLLRQARDVALMGLVRGDHVGKHNVPGPPQFLQTGDTRYLDVEERWHIERAVARSEGRPTMDPHGTGAPATGLLIGLLFYGGFAIALTQAWRSATHAALAGWIVVGSLASVLSYGAPNMLRLLMITPAVAVLASDSAVRLCQAALKGKINREKLSPEASRPPQSFILALAVCMILVNFFQEIRLMKVWPEHPMVIQEFNSEMRLLGDFLREQPDRLPVRMPFDAPAPLRFLAPDYTFVTSEEAVPNDRWWDFRTVQPFPVLPQLGDAVSGGRRLLVIHPAGMPMGELVEVSE